MDILIFIHPLSNLAIFSLFAKSVDRDLTSQLKLPVKQSNNYSPWRLFIYLHLLFYSRVRACNRSGDLAKYAIVKFSFCSLWISTPSPLVLSKLFHAGIFTPATRRKRVIVGPRIIMIEKGTIGTWLLQPVSWWDMRTFLSPKSETLNVSFYHYFQISFLLLKL